MARTGALTRAPPEQLDPPDGEIPVNKTTADRMRLYAIGASVLTFTFFLHEGVAVSMRT